MPDLALKTLLHDRLRFAITVAGVAFAVMLVFVQVGLFLGLMDNASVIISHVDADLWVTSKNTPNIDFPHPFPDGLVQRVRSVPGVARADNLIMNYFNVTLPNGAQESTEIYGLEDHQRWNVPWRVLEGNLGDLRRGAYMFLDQSAVKRMGAFRVGDYREVNGVRLEIIGRTADALSFATTPVGFMDFDLAQRIGGTLLAGQTNYMLVKLAAGADVERVRAEIQRRLPYNDVHTGREWATQSRSYWIVSTGLGLNAGLTVFLGCLVGLVVVAQTLYTSTMDHLKEFGTVKAIGGGNRDIYLILGKQATIAAVVGFVAGVLPSFALRPAMAGVGLKLIIPFPLVLVIFAGTIVLCLGASMVSFRKVAGIDPALVFRT
jgi:putative ABC transport system permease protein